MTEQRNRTGCVTSAGQVWKSGEVLAYIRAVATCIHSLNAEKAHRPDHVSYDLQLNTADMQKLTLVICGAAYQRNWLMHGNMWLLTHAHALRKVSACALICGALLVRPTIR